MTNKHVQVDLDKHHFVRACLRTFRFLKSRKWRYKHQVVVALPEFHVIFFREDVCVVVTEEIGGTPWVFVSKLRGDDKSRDLVDDASLLNLDHLIMLRCPQLALKGFGESTYWSPRKRSALLRQYAEILQSHAQDFLAGDFSTLPLFKKIRRRKLPSRV